MSVIDRKVGRNTTHVGVADEGLVFTKRFEGPLPDRARRYANSLAWDRAQSTFDLKLGPRILSRDDKEFLLTFPYLDGARTLQELIDGDESLDGVIPVIEQCGTAIGALHSIAVEEATPFLSRNAGEQGTAPDPLDLFRHLTPEHYANASGAELELWQLFHHDAELLAGLRSWLESHATEPGLTLIHGDLRPDQFLVSSEGVALIDWEELTVGSPSRDLAGVVGAFFLNALLKTFIGTSVTGELPMELHQGFLSRGQEMLDRIAAAARAFLAAYEARRGVPVDGTRLGADIGWFLIERTIARAMMSHRLLPGDRAVAGVGRQMLLNPTDALVTFGLENR
jgi:hypothetical protein